MKSVLTVSFNKLKNTKAWKLTSLLVRIMSHGKCYTCGKVFPINKLFAGHFIEKRGNANTYFDLDNLKAQCYACNFKEHGRKDVYAMKLIEEYGQDHIKKLFRRAGKSKVWTKIELKKLAEKRQKYCNQASRLEKVEKALKIE